MDDPAAGREAAEFGPLVSAGWLRERLDVGDSPDLLVVDVQFDLRNPPAGRKRYRDGHVPGAVFADIEADLSAPKTGRNGRHPLPPVAGMAAAFGRLGIGPGTAVVAYDASAGMYAARLWWMLRLLGHRRAALLDGGLSAWRGAGGGLRSGAETRAARSFAPQPVASLSPDAGEVAAGLGAGADLLLDAREPERWRGETEPFDPVAGRIPGARNHLWKRNLDADGRFLPGAELARRFAPLAEARGGRRIVCYCGSGLTAAHDALALTLAGFDGVAVYSGSWSEWCADPARPVETGEPAASAPQD